MPTGEGSERNAVRHALWSSAITSKSNAKTAETITNGHEGVGMYDNSEIDHSQPFEGPLSLADSVVDILNNEIGRDIGDDNPDASLLDLGLEVLGVFENEGLWTAKKGKDGIIISRTKISQSQYVEAKKALETLDQNGMSESDKQESEKR